MRWTTPSTAASAAGAGACLWWGHLQQGVDHSAPDKKKTQQIQASNSPLSLFPRCRRGGCTDLFFFLVPVSGLTISNLRRKASGCPAATGVRLPKRINWTRPPLRSPPAPRSARGLLTLRLCNTMLRNAAHCISATPPPTQPRNDATTHPTNQPPLNNNKQPPSCRPSVRPLSLAS